MLEITKKDSLLWRCQILKDEKGNQYRESKPFRSDNKPRQYFFVELHGFERKSTRGNVIIGDEPNVRVTKLVWSDRNRNEFNAIADAVDRGDVDKEGFVIGLETSGVFYQLACSPYYIYDVDGNKILKTDGTPKIGRKVSFFLFANEADNASAEYQRATKDLDYVDAEIDEHGEIEKDIVPTNEPKVNRRG